MLPRWRALRHRPGARVALLDAPTFPRDKACGDGIAPHCFEELRGLGVFGVERRLRPGRPAPLPDAGGRDVLALPPRASYVIPRTVFDARLVAAAQAAGATLIKARVRGLTVGPDDVTLDLAILWVLPTALPNRFAAGSSSAPTAPTPRVRRALGLPGQPAVGHRRRHACLRPGTATGSPNS